MAVDGAIPAGGEGPTPPPVRYGRLKLVGVLLIGGLIAFQGLSDADHLALLGHRWAPPARPGAALVLGAFYALERYLSRSPTWYKPDAG